MFQHAKDAGVGIRDSSTTYRNITQYCNSAEFGYEAETAEVTTFNSTNDTKQYVAGLKDGTFSAEGKWDATIDGYLWGIIGKSKTIDYFPASTDANATNFRHYSFTGICTKYSPPASVDDANTWSAEWQISGTVSRTTST